MIGIANLSGQMALENEIPNVRLGQRRDVGHMNTAVAADWRLDHLTRGFKMADDFNHLATPDARIVRRAAMGVVSGHRLCASSLLITSRKDLDHHPFLIFGQRGTPFPGGDIFQRR